MLLTQGLELKVDTKVYNLMELFSLCKWERFYQRLVVTLFLQLK